MSGGWGERPLVWVRAIDPDETFTGYREMVWQPAEDPWGLVRGGQIWLDRPGLWWFHCYVELVLLELSVVAAVRNASLFVDSTIPAATRVTAVTPNTTAPGSDAWSVPLACSGLVLVDAASVPMAALTTAIEVTGSQPGDVWGVPTVNMLVVYLGQTRSP